MAGSIRYFLLGMIAWGVVSSAIGAMPGKKPKTMLVPPTREIEILDPGVNPLGEPHPVLYEKGDGLGLDVPPTILVHHFYYTGDRTFQGPMLPGGPMIVVANHPRTGERCYVPVQMPPGAPRVTYTAHAISYDFGPNVIAVDFKRNGTSLVRVQRSSFHPLTPKPHAPHAGIVAGSANVLVTAGENVVGAGKTITRPVTRAFYALPLTRTPEERALRREDAASTAATEANERLNATIPTVR